MFVAHSMGEQEQNIFTSKSSQEQIPLGNPVQGLESAIHSDPIPTFPVGWILCRGLSCEGHRVSGLFTCAGPSF